MAAPTRYKNGTFKRNPEEKVILPGSFQFTDRAKPVRRGFFQ